MIAVSLTVTGSAAGIPLAVKLNVSATAWVAIVTGAIHRLDCVTVGAAEGFEVRLIDVTELSGPVAVSSGFAVHPAATAPANRVKGWLSAKV